MLLGYTLFGKDREESAAFIVDRSALLRAEEALRISEARFRAVQETSPDGFMILESVREPSNDPDQPGGIVDFTWVYVNESAARIVGRPRESFIGTRLLESMPGNRDEGLFRQYVDVVETGQTLHRELQYTRDGVDIYIRLVAAKVGDGFAVSFADLSDRRRAELAVRESEARFRMMADGLPAIVWVHDASGAQQFVNRTFVEFFNVEHDEMTGDRWQQLIHPEDGPAYVESFMQAVRERRDFHGNVRVKVPDGGWRWIESFGRARFSESGEFLGHVGVSLDVTQKREAEIALREADEAKDEFIATLAHELRNPLAAIRGAIGLLKIAQRGTTSGTSKPGAGSGKTAVDILDRQTQQMVRLVDDLMDVSRVSRGKVTLKLARVDLATVVQHAVEATAVPCRERNLQLDVSLETDPIALHADGDRLAQVIGNLLSNACKFTEPGGRIELIVRREPNPTTRGDDAVILVRDNGIGIPPEQIGRIFRLFAQVDTSTHRAQAGLGIGLSLVKSIAEMHGGSVSVESAGLGRGSTFTLRLPALAKSASIEAGVSLKPRHEGAPVARTILLVDDNPDALAVLRLLLESAGHTVHTAGDGTGAVDRAVEVLPDAVLLDIGMPGVDGYEAARRIRARTGDDCPLLIALTGWGQERDRRRSAEAGFDAHFVKPVNLDELHRLLATQTEARDPALSGASQ